MSNPIPMFQPPTMAFAAVSEAVEAAQAQALPVAPQRFTDAAAGQGGGQNAFHAPSVQSAPRLPFDLLFQTKAVGILMREPTMLADYIDVLKPGYFESGMHRYVVKLIFDYYTKFKSAPTLAALELMIADECHRLQHNDTMKMELLEVAREAATVSLEESRYIAKRMTDFAKKNAAKEIAIDLVQTIQEFEVKGEGNFDDIAPKIRRLAAIGAPGGKGTDFVEGIDSLTTRLQSSTMYSRGAKIPTGLRKLDHILDGGMSAGEIGFIAAPPGVGKSTLLTQFAASALKAKFNVFIATMELKEEDYEMRMHQHMCGVGKAHIISGSQRYDSRRPAMNETLKDSMCVIKYYPPGTASVDTLRSFFGRVKAEKDNGKPWLIVVDYLEKLRLGDPEKVQSYELIGMVVNELIAFGFEFNSPVLTASQINRQGYSKVRGSGGRKHTSKEDIASSWKKVEAADLVLMFDQAELEKAQGTARLRIEKCRRGKDGILIKLRDERPVMNMVELDDANQPILAYSPKRMERNDELDPETGLPGDWLVVRPEWDQATPFSDETEAGYIRPPQIEIDEYLQEQVQGLSDEQIGLDLEQVKSSVEKRGGDRPPAIAFEPPPILGDVSAFQQIAAQFQPPEGARA